MNAKTTAVLEKCAKERSRGAYSRAIKRLEEAIDTDPSEPAYYKEGIDTALEAGESRLACQFFRTALRRLPDQFELVWQFASERVKRYNDGTLGHFMLEVAVRERKLDDAEVAISNLKDHTASDVLKRVRTRKRAMQAPIGGSGGLHDELVNSALTEGLLCLRLKSFTEGIDLFLSVLRDQPSDYRHIGPFLGRLEKRFPKQAGIKYALGCALLLAKKYDLAIDKLVLGAVSSPQLAADCINKLESMRNQPGVSTDELEISLLKLYLVLGDNDMVVDVTRNIIAEKPFRAPAILDLVRSRADSSESPPALRFLIIELAIVADKSEVALKHLRELHAIESERGNVFNYLDTLSRERALPGDILAVFGEFALEQGLVSRAAEIFREVVAHSPSDIAAVRTIIGRNPGHAELEQLQRDLDVPRLKKAGDGVATRNTPPPRPQPEKATSTTEPITSPTTPAENSTKPVEKPKPPHSSDGGIFTRDESRVFDLSENAGDASFIERPKDSLLGLSRDAKPATQAPRETERDRTGTPDRPPILGEVPERLDTVERVREKPATRQTTQPEPPPPTEEEPEPFSGFTRGEDMYESDYSYVPSTSPAQEDERLGHDNFADYFGRFKHGELAPEKTLELIELATTLGMWNEAKQLLSFEPRNIGQEIKRKYFLAEYYFAQEQALAALVILKTVNLLTLGKGERLEFLIKIADCYKSLNRYEAAQGVYLRLLSEFPDLDKVETMAKQNYDRYLQDLASGGPVLEKITSL